MEEPGDLIPVQVSVSWSADRKSPRNWGKWRLTPLLRLHSWGSRAYDVLVGANSVQAGSCVAIDGYVEMCQPLVVVI